MSIRFWHIRQLILLVSILQVHYVHASPSLLNLPTGNDHLLSNDRGQFYMYVHRDFEGEITRPWTGGKYGFVRDLKRTKDGLIGTSLHEGIDIKPLTLDKQGNPLDEILSISRGVVAYTNNNPARSSYGKYIVIEHNWGDGPFFSLYAHLSKVSVKAGQPVNKGQKIGVMGYTGSGLNRERAHLHLELNLLLSTDFNQWHREYFKGNKNYHGIHHGLNLSGLNIANFYLAQHKDPSLTLSQFIQSMRVYYKVTLPRKGRLALLERYPWLERGISQVPTPSWEIAFTASGFPLSISPSHRSVTKPQVTSVCYCLSKHEYHTKGIISGSGYRATLSQTGRQFIELISSPAETAQKDN